MSRAMTSRIGKLKAARQSPPLGRNHLILGHSDANLEQQEEAKRAAGEIQDGDRVMRLLFVKPGEAVVAEEDPDREATP